MPPAHIGRLPGTDKSQTAQRKVQLPQGDSSLRLSPRDESSRFLHDVPMDESKWGRSLSKRQFVDRSDPSAQVYSRPLENSPLRSPAGVSFVRPKDLKIREERVAVAELVNTTMPSKRRMSGWGKRLTKPPRSHRSGRPYWEQGQIIKAENETMHDSTIPAYRHRATYVKDGQSSAGLVGDDRLAIRQASKANRQLEG